MLTKIALKNFMSHKETVLELGPGLTVVTGPNNCGKSAVVAALQLVCRNHLGDLVVRHGEKECTVTLWTDDPHEITWRRKGKEVTYTIDGKEHGRLKGKPPEVLHDLLRLPEIVEAESTFDLHFGLQKEPIFLLHQAGSQAAKFFASASDAARLMAMQALHKKRTSDRKLTVKNLKLEETRLQEQLHRLEPLEDRREEVQWATETHQSLCQAIEQETSLAQDCQRLQKQAEEVAGQTKQLTLLAALPALPALAPTDELQNWLVEVEHTQDRIGHSTRVVQACKPLTAPPALADVSALHAVVDQLQRTQKQMTRLTRHSELLQKLEPPSTPIDLTSLATSVRQLNDAVSAHKDATSKLDAARQAEEQAQKQLQRWLKQHPECPVCHRPWQESRGHKHA